MSNVSPELARAIHAAVIGRRDDIVRLLVDLVSVASRPKQRAGHDRDSTSGLTIISGVLPLRTSIRLLAASLAIASRVVTVADAM